MPVSPVQFWPEPPLEIKVLAKGLFLCLYNINNAWLSHAFVYSAIESLFASSVKTASHGQAET